MNKCYTKEVLGELPAVLRWLLFILFVVIFCDNWELSFDAKNLVGIIDNPEDYLQKRQ